MYILQEIEYCIFLYFFMHINSISKSKILSLNRPMYGGLNKLRNSYKACLTECSNPLKAEDWSHNKILTRTKTCGLLLFVQPTFFQKSYYMFIYFELHQYPAQPQGYSHFYFGFGVQWLTAGTSGHVQRRDNKRPNRERKIQKSESVGAMHMMNVVNVVKERTSRWAFSRYFFKKDALQWKAT